MLKRSFESAPIPADEPTSGKPGGSLQTLRGEAREITGERLGRILAPIEAELQRCKELFAAILAEHEAEREPGVIPVAPLPGRLPDEGSLSFPLVIEMASQLQRMEGKWIRAGVVLLAGKVFSPPSEETIRVAGALELIHLATLVHDDIIDRADTRRGFPALPRLHGEAVAVLMGDLLYAKAMRLLVATDHTPVLKAVSGSVEVVCLGEISEHQFSWDSPPSESDYLAVIRRKTASLLECCARSGCLLADRDGAWADRFAEFGLNLGMAFQITDDILDLIGDGPSLGKEPGADLRNGRLTLPLIHFAERHSSAPLRGLLASAPGSDSRLVHLLEESGSLEYARRAACGFASKALAALAPIERVIPESAELRSLRDLAALVVDRGY